MSKEEVVESPFSALKKKTLEGKGRLSQKHSKDAGRILKSKGEAAAVEFMLQHASLEEIPNFGAPAKCNVVAQSRPFVEWPISRVSAVIQRYIYDLKVSEVPPDASKLTSSSAHDRWFKETGISDCGYRNVQGLNKILSATINRYHGVILKVENRNKKKLERFERNNKRNLDEGREPEALEEGDLEIATGECGHLIQPPGINRSIYGYKDVHPVPFVPSKHRNITLPAEYAGYNRDPNAPLEVIVDRLTIPKGQPGYVPEWQRATLSPNKHKRMRQWYSAQKLKGGPGKRKTRTPEEKVDLEAKASTTRKKDALLAVLRIGEDWVLMDLRGLLRNLRWRELAPKDLTLNTLLKQFFTGDPVIDPKRGVVTFIYKQAALGIVSRKTMASKRGKTLLEEFSAPDAEGQRREVGLVAIDLGQTNPVAASIARIGRSEEDPQALKADILENFFLPDNLLDEVKAYRVRSDALEACIKEAAINTLPEEARKEVLAQGVSEEDAKRQLCEELDLSASELPWDLMKSNTTYISDAYLARGGDPALTAATFTRGKVTKTIKKGDFRWAKKYRPSLSKATAKLYLNALWELKRSDDGYTKLSRSKLEFARRCANYILARTKKVTQCEKNVLVIEDLNVSFFNGKGKRSAGWVNYFRPQKENRWFIQVLHKALSNLAQHKSAYVIEGSPYNTSCTCPVCKHCDQASRKGERFECVECKRTFHADLEVATRNLIQVALTGVPLPRIKKLRGTKKAGVARKSKASEPQANVEGAPNPSLENAAE